MTLPVLVINRDQDAARLSTFAASAEQYGVSFERVPAFDAHAPNFPFAKYTELVGDHFWGQPDIKPGALGCYLSHARAWTQILDKNWPHALICEDDAVFYKTPLGLENHIEDLSNPEVVFLNQRLASWALAVTRFPFADLNEVLGALASLGGPKANGLKSAPGGDCYLLTARGAERLLEHTARSRIVCGVDWAMIWSSLTAVSDEMSNAFPELGILRAHLPVPVDPIRAVVFTDPVADQSGKTGSTIKHAVTRAISELR